MSFLDNFVKGFKEEFIGRIQQGQEILALRKEEKEKFLELGVKAYVQNIKDAPEVYGKVNKVNIVTLEMLTAGYQKAIEKAETYKDDRAIRMTANLSSGGLRTLITYTGADMRYLKSKGRDTNKIGYLKGARFGAKIPGELK